MDAKHWTIGLLLGGVVVLFCQFDFGGRNIPPLKQSERAVQVASRPVPATAPATAISLASESKSSKSTPASIPSGDLKELLRRSIKDAKYRPATPADLVGFERLLARTLDVPAGVTCLTLPHDLVAQWQDTGWELHRCDGDVLVISEAIGKQSGRGIYAISGAVDSRIVLQAPHRFYDEGSGLIVRKLFQEHCVRAAAWNTVHRREVDLAHAENQYLNAFTRALLVSDRETTFVQLHGFNSEKYAWDVTTRAGSASLILSDGSQFPSRETIRMAANLKAAFSAKAALLYPNEADVLGGTKNQQARLLRNLGSGRFLHVEMSKSFRKQMLDSKAVRREFFESM